MRNYSKFKVAAIQAAPVYLDMEASVSKACSLIAEAAQNGAKVVVFPESFLPGYPYWCWLTDPFKAMPLTQVYAAMALDCPGPELARIGAAAKANGIIVCIGAAERESSTIYATQFLFDDSGNLLGKHRKLKPMYTERLHWGEGDASTMRVQDTKVGKIGMLMSSEHSNPMNLMVLGAQREELHLGSYPALGKRAKDYLGYHVNKTQAEYYAVANSCFVVMATEVITDKTLAVLTKDHPEFIPYLSTAATQGLGGGAAAIFDPNSTMISKPLPHDQEGIVYADIDTSIIGVATYFMDTTGHYCNAALHLDVDTTEKKVVRGLQGMADNFVAYDALQKAEE